MISWLCLISNYITNNTLSCLKNDILGIHDYLTFFRRPLFPLSQEEPVIR